MKILLDECLPIDFRHQLPGHEVYSAEWAGFKGMKNGKLLREVESAGYDVIPHNRPRHSTPTKFGAAQNLDLSDPYTYKPD